MTAKEDFRKHRWAGQFCLRCRAAWYASEEAGHCPDAAVFYDQHVRFWKWRALILKDYGNATANRYRDANLREVGINMIRSE